MKPDIIVPAQPKPVEIPLSLKAAGKLIERHKGKDQDDVLDMMLRGADSLTADAELIPVACARIMANKMQSELKNASAARRRVREIVVKATAKIDADRERAERAVSRLEAPCCRRSRRTSCPRSPAKSIRAKSARCCGRWSQPREPRLSRKQSKVLMRALLVLC